MAIKSSNENDRYRARQRALPNWKSPHVIQRVCNRILTNPDKTKVIWTGHTLRRASDMALHRRPRRQLRRQRASHRAGNKLHSQWRRAAAYDCNKRGGSAPVVSDDYVHTRSEGISASATVTSVQAVDGPPEECPHTLGNPAPLSLRDERGRCGGSSRPRKCPSSCRRGIGRLSKSLAGRRRGCSRASGVRFRDQLIIKPALNQVVQCGQLPALTPDLQSQILQRSNGLGKLTGQVTHERTR